MTDPQVCSDDTFLRIKACRAIRKILSREKQVYLIELHRRTGLGLDSASFKSLVDGLAQQGWCSLKEGRLGALMVTLTETPSESVIA